VRGVRRSKYTHLWGLITYMIVRMFMISFVLAIAESARAVVVAGPPRLSAKFNMLYSAYDPNSKRTRKLFSEARGNLCHKWLNAAIPPPRPGGLAPDYRHIPPLAQPHLNPVDYIPLFTEFLEQRPWLTDHGHRRHCEGRSSQQGDRCLL
jgi:hypothetical protein